MLVVLDAIIVVLLLVCGVYSCIVRCCCSVVITDVVLWLLVLSVLLVDVDWLMRSCCYICFIVLCCVGLRLSV